MATPPTRSSYGQTTTWAGTTTLTTTSLTWSAGSLVIVLGATADNGVFINLPTATGLTFAAITATAGVNPTNTTSTCKVYGWAATAGSSGSGAVTATVGGNVGQPRGLACWVYDAHGGIGAAAFSVADTNPNGPLTRTGDNSMVAWIGADWGAVNDVAVTKLPAGGTQDHAQWMSGQFTGFACDWGDQAAAGTTTYGLLGSSFSTTSLFARIAVEILGTGAAAATLPPRRARQTRSRPAASRATLT